VILVSCAIVWDWQHRFEVALELDGASKKLAGETGVGAGLDLRFRKALEDVATGSLNGLDPEPDSILKLPDGEELPSIDIPNLGISLQSLARWLEVLPPLRRTRISATVATTPGSFQLWLEIRSRGGAQVYVNTPSEQNLDTALLDGAQLVYGALRPLVLASFLFTHSEHPEVALQPVRHVVTDRNARPEYKAAAYRIWGLVLRAEGDYEGARMKLHKAIDGWGATAWTNHHLPAAAWVDLARISLWEGRWGEAITACRNAASLDPDWAVPHGVWGDVLLARGSLADAIDEYAEAITKDRSNSYLEPLNGWARALATQGEWPLAIERYEAARDRQAERDGTATETYAGLGEALYALGQFDAAVWHYDSALSIEPDRFEARYGRSRAAECAAWVRPWDPNLWGIPWLADPNAIERPRCPALVAPVVPERG
jgi:tetratricopeptide (TPR) repeat protein